MGKKLMEGKKSKKTMESQIDSLTGEVSSLREANAVLLRQLQDTPIGDEIEVSGPCVCVVLWCSYGVSLKVGQSARCRGTLDR